jgi:hypothetical protein
MVMAVAGRHFPKIGERKNKRVQVHIHGKGGGATGCRMGLFIWDMGGGSGALLKPGSRTHLTPWA